METHLERNVRITDEFRVNEGRVGGKFEGAPMILIHHVGAKSGTERVSPLVCFPQDDGTIVICASRGGGPNNPGWYHNLKANPKIDVEYGTEKFQVAVTEFVGTERDEAWARCVETRPSFADYQERTTRVIPVLALSRLDK